MTERCVEELSYRTATGSDHAVHPVVYLIYMKLRNTLSVRQESFYLAGTLGGPDNDEVLVSVDKAHLPLWLPGDTYWTLLKGPKIWASMPSLLR